MKNQFSSIEDYINGLNSDDKEVISEIRMIAKSNLPKGFIEEINYGMIGYVVPLKKFPDGYLNKKDVPLPFINIGVFKNHYAIYHMAMYSNKNLYEWFVNEFIFECGYKPDIGKSCIRLKKNKQIPYNLLTKLFQKITVDEWIEMYTKNRVI